MHVLLTAPILMINRQSLGTLSLLLFSWLSGCTPSGDPIAQTSCNTALADATYTWRVEYFTSRSRGGPQGTRVEEFSSTRLRNQNGEKPGEAVTGPDDQGIWWPALPPRPSADEIDQHRQTGEFNDPPRLQRQVRYQLQCQDGTLAADDRTYREAARSIRARRSVQVNYTLGRVLEIQSAE